MTVVITFLSNYHIFFNFHLPETPLKVYDQIKKDYILTRQIDDR